MILPNPLLCACAVAGPCVHCKFVTVALFATAPRFFRNSFIAVFEKSFHSATQLCNLNINFNLYIKIRKKKKHLRL